MPATLAHMARDYRSDDRTVSVTFRMSADQRERLETEKRESGLDSLQQLLDLRVFGASSPRRKPGPQPQAERLDISA